MAYLKILLYGFYKLRNACGVKPVWRLKYFTK